MLQDLRYSFRRLGADWRFTLTGVLTFCLGIGASTAVFSVVNELLLRSLPFVESKRLVVPTLTRADRAIDRGNVAYTDYMDWQTESVFESVAVYRNRVWEISGGTGPEAIEGANVSLDYFSVLGVQPVLGRTFLPKEHEPDGERVVLISYRLWQRHFGGDPDIVGKMISVNGHAGVRICGVLPAGCEWLPSHEMWMPIAYGSSLPEPALRRDNFVWGAIARLKDGRPLTETQATVEAISQRVEEQNPDKRSGWRTRIIPINEWIVGPQLRQALLILFGIVMLVLLLTCANVASLLLARAPSRQSEIAIRVALGADTLRVIRLFLAETFLLASAGGIAAIMLAFWLRKILILLAPNNLRVSASALDLRATAFLLATVVLSAVMSGLIPAIQGSSAAPTKGLKTAERAAAGNARSNRIRSLIVTFEIAMSLVLLIGAGLMLTSFVRLQQADIGFKADGLLTLRILLPNARYPDVAASYARILEELNKIPGVALSSASSSLPVGGGGSYLARVFLAEGRPEPPAAPDCPGHWNVVTPGYFETMGIPLIEGRDFNEQDSKVSKNVIIINRAMARQIFPNERPIGKRIRSWRDENKLREIVGVVENVRYLGIEDRDRPLVYVPHAQDMWIQMALNVRTLDSPLNVINAVREEIHHFDPELAIAHMETMTGVLSRSISGPRYNATVLTLFAGVALLLTAVGVFGVISHSVSQRTREIGIRIALGATRGTILLLVIKQGLVSVLLGIVIGLLGASILTRVLGSLLYEIGTIDLATFGSLSLLILIVACLAMYVPARKAIEIDPAAALRHE
jgi:putative ABC transport system permease protein